MSDLSLVGAEGSIVPSTLTYNDSTHTATLTPSKPLKYNTTYTATISGVVGSDGKPMAQPYVWSFTTGPPPNLISTTADEFVLEAKGDMYGTVQVHLQNRTGSNGILVSNLSVDLVDIVFLTKSNKQFNLRGEHRSASVWDSRNSDGEFQVFVDGLASSHLMSIGSSVVNVYPKLSPKSGIELPKLADSDATMDTLYFSTTQNKVSYRDTNGVIHVMQ